MQEILFWLIVIPVMSAIGVVLSRYYRHEYPLSSGAVDYKRIAWPVGQSGVQGGYQPFYVIERTPPPRSASAIFTTEEVARMELPTPSISYTPLLDDEPYEHEEETGNEAVLKLQSKPDDHIVTIWR